MTATVLPVSSARERRSLPPALVTAIAVVGMLALWELAARTVFANAYTLSGPIAIVRQISRELGLYRRNLVATLANAGWGFLWGNLAATAFAAVATLAPSLRRIVNGIALTSFCLPLVALAPVLRVVFGPGGTTAIVLGALAAFFTSNVAAVLGFDAAPGAALEVVHSYGRGRWFAFALVRLRASVPALFAGFQVAAPAAFLGAMVGEFTGASRGLGVLTVQALRTLETDRVWAIAAVSTAVSCVAYVGIGALARLLCPWAAGVDTTARAATRRRGGWLGQLVALVIPVVVVIVLWLGFLRVFDVDPYFAKTPLDVWRSLVTDPGAPEMRDLVLPALWSTLGTTLLGFVAGLAAGVALATAFVLVPVLQRTVLPIAVALRAVPIITTTPVVVLLFGRGLLATVVIVAVMSFFPTLVNTTAAMRRTPTGILEVLHSYHAPSLVRAWFALIPNAVPALLASARIAVPTSLLAATVAEWLATGRGIGNLMTVAANTARYDQLWACVALLTAIAVIGYALVGWLERIVLRQMNPERTA